VEDLEEGLEHLVGESPDDAFSDAETRECELSAFVEIGHGSGGLAAGEGAERGPQGLCDFVLVEEEIRGLALDGEDEGGDDEAHSFSARDGLDFGQAAEQGGVRFEVDTDFFAGLAAHGVEQARVGVVASPAREGHVARPGVVGVLGAAHEKDIDVGWVRSRAEDGGHSRLAGWAEGIGQRVEAGEAGGDGGEVVGGEHVERRGRPSWVGRQLKETMLDFARLLLALCAASPVREEEHADTDAEDEGFEVR